MATHKGHFYPKSIYADTGNKASGQLKPSPGFIKLILYVIEFYEILENESLTNSSAFLVQNA
jgi:hypothetical protein